MLQHGTRDNNVVTSGFKRRRNCVYRHVIAADETATSDGRTTSVGTLAMDRFLRPVAYQDVPDALLPDAVRESNPDGLLRLVDGAYGRD